MESTSATATMEPAASAAVESTAAEATGARHAGESVIALHARYAAVLDSAKRTMTAFGGARQSHC